MKKRTFAFGAVSLAVSVVAYACIYSHVDRDAWPIVMITAMPLGWVIAEIGWRIEHGSK